MPWDLKKKSSNYFNAGVVSAFVSAALVLL
jgi:hypothetical protein